jgi:hypothetical protein
VIRYEILLCHPAFPNETDPKQMISKMLTKEKRPEIPGFVLPFARELMVDCLAQVPGDRPSFDEIVNRLKKMNIKVIAEVNSAK